MMEKNPYASPSANLFGDAGAVLSTGQVIGVAESTAEVLRRTKPWARFVGIMVMLYGPLIMLVAVGLGIASMAGGGPFGGGGQSQAFRTGAGIGFMLVYGFMGYCIFHPGLKLNKFANRIGALLRDPTMAGLDAALGQLRGAFKFVGILIVVVIGLVVVLLSTALMVRVRP